ncbi:hypothetical protein JZ751_005374 [Albula glossodonta]|uniref:Uncharacterized protein n=1 Tax=Albula glossodonta TaxID=121402 RepID=A0A8T2N4I0_9TELE|nr:hypothetical protein JZ751_005374 [Albula glossodonta]
MQRSSVSSEETESGHTSPGLLDSVFSPQHQRNRRSWPGASRSVDICEVLGGWSGPSDLSNLSDTEEEDVALLVSEVLGRGQLERWSLCRSSTDYRNYQRPSC